MQLPALHPVSPLSPLPFTFSSALVMVLELLSPSCVTSLPFFCNKLSLCALCCFGRGRGVLVGGLLLVPPVTRQGKRMGAIFAAMTLMTSRTLKRSGFLTTAASVARAARTLKYPAKPCSTLQTACTHTSADRR